MVRSDPFLIATILVVLGGIAISRARKPYDRYTTITDLMSEPMGVRDPGEETILRGPVHVTNPANPERVPPEPIDEGDSPALWAWRIRRKVATDSGSENSHWKTVVGGLSVGDFSVEQDWEQVRVDVESFRNQQDDPFESQYLYLDDPEHDILLGELDPINKFLERVGLAGDDGILTDWDVTLSAGRKTTSPDRYQATIIGAGEDLLVRGELTETTDGLVLKHTEETPLIIANGRLEEKGDRLRSKAIKQVVLGLALILLAGVVAIAPL